MNKNKNIIKALWFAPLVFLLSACFEEPGTETFIKDTYIEFGEATTSGGVDLPKAYVRINDGLPKKDSIRINLVGAHRKSAINVNFEVLSTSTAVAGVHYEMISGNTVQIPANSSFGYIYFNVLVDNIDPGETWKIAFRLTGSDASDIKLSANYDEFTRGLRITCPLDLDDFVGTAEVVDPFWEETYDVSIVRDGNNLKVTGWFGLAGTNPITLTVNPTTGAISIARQVFVGSIAGFTYTNWATQGSGSFDPCDRKITLALQYSVDQGNFSGTWTTVATME